ncbi:MAG: glutamate 5-kinase, partial [Nitrospirae bacterium]
MVVKVGSNIIAEEGGLNRRRISAIARQLSELHSEGHRIVLVSSGAIAAGMVKLGLKKRPHEIQLKQAAAAVGQSTLMWFYEKRFSRYNKKVAQVLLTRDAFYDRVRYINARNTFMTLLQMGVIPIVNENDTVAIDEIKFGDNDQLAALVAASVEADRLIILSDVEGLFTSDPKKDTSARLIEEVRGFDNTIEQIAKPTTGQFGTGGMYSKVLAAKKAVQFGIKVHIINGHRPSLIKKIMEGKKAGTVFLPLRQKVSARKTWIALGTKSKGSLVIDEGAAEAILHKNRSLLPGGILKVQGRFQRGDAVYCVDTK